MARAKRYDVIVVGGGPAGACAARAACQGGAHVMLLEEHTQVGRPIQCTGLLSVHGIEATQTRREHRLRAISGVSVIAPDGARLELGGSRVQAYVINRDRLDQQLIEDATAQGVEVRTGMKAVAWEPGRLQALDPTTQERLQLQAPLVIGADGPHSRMARWAKLPRPRKFIYGLQVLVPHRPLREDAVDVRLGREVAPNFFAWAVPAGSGTARVGLGTDSAKGAQDRLNALLSSAYSTEILSIQGGTIPIGLPKRTVADGLMLVGDAAGQAKPTSGGGIYTGSVCGRIAGEVAAEQIKKGDVSSKALQVYERRWRAAFERELTFGWHAHRLLCSLSDEQLNRIICWLAQPEVQLILEEHGDIDYPSACMKEIVRHRHLWRGLLKLIPAGTWIRAALSLSAGAD